MRSDARALRAPLLRWYRKHRRDLPWRRTRDPYAIWVSEVMLQQTTVAAVVPYWERFLERFPDVASLARAREESVLAAWSGLGYYSRARALRRGAIAVMEHHAGRVPDDRERLETLPGVGRYTAGAIASVAFSREEPVVDGNVRRVFARVFALAATEGVAAETTLWSLAGALVLGPDPGDLNQAVMELGATVCSPRAPRCGACPLRKRCRAFALGRAEDFPAAKRRPVLRRVRVAAAWIERRGRLLVERRREGGVFRGAWDLPAVVVPGASGGAGALRADLRARRGLSVAPGESVARFRHTILATILEVDVVTATLRRPAAPDAALRWIDPRQLGETAVSGATLKAARAIYAAASSASASSSGSSSRANR